MLEARARNSLLYPLLVLRGVTVLYLPPRSASKVDLDNLVRGSIIPAVHEILQPPGIPGDFLVSVNAGKIDRQLTEMLERYKRAPKFHITGYQVFCLPRTPQDPENGNVRLIMHGGDNWEQRGSSWIRLLRSGKIRIQRTRWLRYSAEIGLTHRINRIGPRFFQLHSDSPLANEIKITTSVVGERVLEER